MNLFYLYIFVYRRIKNPKIKQNTKQKYNIFYYYTVMSFLMKYNVFSVEFRSKVACENEVVNLQCNPNSRLAMFSASYGRTEYESIQCPQPQGVPEESKYCVIINLLSKL